MQHFATLFQLFVGNQEIGDLNVQMPSQGEQYSSGIARAAKAHGGEHRAGDVCRLASCDVVDALRKSSIHTALGSVAWFSNSCGPW